MNTELRKRLEEAAKQYCKDFGRTGEVNGFDVTAFKKGVEYGYKEAIALAKEWIRKRNDIKYLKTVIGDTLLDTRRLAADFESDMNKLLED